MKVNVEEEDIQLIFKPDDLIIEIEVDNPKNVHYSPEVYERFPFNNFNTAVERYLELVKKYDKKDVTLRIVSQTNKHGILVNVGNINFIVVTVSTQEIRNEGGD